MGAWPSWRAPPRRGRLAVSAPDRDHPRRRHLHHAPSPPELAGRTARVPAVFAPTRSMRSTGLSSCEQRRSERTVEGSSAGLISVRSATRRCPPPRRIAPRAPCAQQRGLGVMTPVGWRRAAHARRLRKPRRRALHRPRFPPVAVAALDAEREIETETLPGRPGGQGRLTPPIVSSSRRRGISFSSI